MMNREEWLSTVADTLISELFEPAGYGKNATSDSPLSEKLRVSCGYPTGKALKRDGKAIGQCFTPEASTAGNTELFISPFLGRGMPGLPIDLNYDDVVIATLAHEIAHAACGAAAGHGPEFEKCCHAIGLVGVATHTTAGPDLQKLGRALVKRIGEYDHDSIDIQTIPVASTQLLKCMCLNTQCPGILAGRRAYVVRMTWYHGKHGTPFCGLCKERMSIYLPRVKGVKGKGAGDRDPDAQPVAVGDSDGGGADEENPDVPFHTDPDSGDGEPDPDDDGQPAADEPDDDDDDQEAADEPDSDPGDAGPDDKPDEEGTASDPNATGGGVKGARKPRTGGKQMGPKPVTPKHIVTGQHSISMTCDCDNCVAGRKLAGLEI